MKDQQDSRIRQVVTEHGGELIRYSAMCTAIQECHRVDEVKEIRSRALALEVYAAQALNTDAERKACEIRLRAERRAGELLKEMGQNGQRQKAGGDPLSRAMTMTPKLSDLGITRNQSSKWQQLAEVPQDDFEAALSDPSSKPSTDGILSRKTEELPRMDAKALWLWGRLRDFERDRIAERDPQELFDAMTDTMQADVTRIAPTVVAFLKEIV